MVDEDSLVCRNGGSVWDDLMADASKPNEGGMKASKDLWSVLMLK